MASSGSSEEDAVDSSTSKTVCRLCRQRKTKCDRQLPKCSFCVKAKVDCQYLPEPRKRGLRAGYVTELESRIKALEQQVDTLSQSSPNPRSAIPNVFSPRSSVLSGPVQGEVNLPNPNLGLNSTTTRDAAINDLTTLPHSYFSILADLWFKEDHHWLPILDHEYVQGSLAELPPSIDHIPDIVLRALIALKLAYSSPAISLGYRGRERLSQYLRAEVVTEAMAKPSLNSIRAMFIIAMLDFGSDNIQSTFNLMSMCRRTGEQIGIFRQLRERVEAQSPEFVGPPSHETFLDNAQIAQTWAVVSFDAVSSLGASWRDASASLVEHFSGIAFASTPDFRDSFVTHVHLAAIGIQPVQDFYVACVNGRHSVLEGDALNIAEEVYQNLISYLHGIPMSGYTMLADGAVDFDINHIFTRLLSNTAIIILYQRYLFGEHNAKLVRERCMDAYFQIIDVVRNISDVDTEINSPCFSHFLGTVARFRLILERMTGEKREPLFDCLMHGISMCGRRWPLARRIDISLRAALIEIDTGHSSGLPIDFWDPKKSVHETYEATKPWVNQYRPYMLVGSLDGPYA